MNIADKIDIVFQRTTKLGGDKNINKVNNYFDFEAWQWPQGVGMYGMYRAFKNSGNKEYLDYILGWYERRFSEQSVQKNINTVAPLYTLTYLYEDGYFQTQQTLKMFEEWAEWIMTVLPKASCGGFEHFVESNYDTSQQLWDDTLYMTVLFLARAGIILNRKDYINQAELQFLIHIHYLCDAKTGLFYHGWHSTQKHNFGKVFWGRGNSWLTAGIVDFIEITKNSSVREFLITIFKDQVEKLVELQDDDGMWHTVLNRTDVYPETSATAAITYGILKGIRLGILDDKKHPVAEKSVKALLTQIDENGTVLNVSAGTTVGMSEEDYLKIPIQERIYGQSMMLLALAEC